VGKSVCDTEIQAIEYCCRDVEAYLNHARKADIDNGCMDNWNKIRSSKGDGQKCSQLYATLPYLVPTTPATPPSCKLHGLTMFGKSSICDTGITTTASCCSGVETYTNDTSVGPNPGGACWVSTWNQFMPVINDQKKCPDWFPGKVSSEMATLEKNEHWGVVAVAGACVAGCMLVFIVQRAFPRQLATHQPPLLG